MLTGPTFMLSRDGRWEAETWEGREITSLLYFAIVHQSLSSALCCISRMEMAAAAVPSVESNPMHARQAGMWGQRSSGRLGNVHLLLLAGLDMGEWKYMDIRAWSPGQIEISSLRVTLIWANSFACLSYTRWVWEQYPVSITSMSLRTSNSTAGK